MIKVLIVPIGAERARRELLAIPLAWCAVSGATLWAIEAPGAWVMAIAAGVALLFRLPDRKRA